MLEKTYYHSPVGWLEIQGGPFGVRAVRFVEGAALRPAAPSTPLLTACVAQLAEYFRGERCDFDLPLDFGDAPEFQRAVWKELLRVPYGQTTTYSAIAQQIGRPGAARAVGLANRHNPIAIIVPCHRCIAQSGDLQGYFRGLEVKRRLLALENPHSYAPQGSLF
jgi:methylated-DNA-[protein]-cysteine S-methyltransferase